MANLTYFKKFDTKNDYDAYIGGTPVLPNVSIVANEDVYFKDGEAPEPPHDYSQDYLTFEVISGGTISSLVDGVLLSKDNGESWYSEITGLTSGDNVIAKGDVHSFGGDSEASFAFGDTVINVYGNIMSIYDSQNFRTTTTLNEGDCFNFLFLFGTQIISAENLVLPATTLAYGCYAGMFQGCTSLTTAPVLPAATLVEKCYYGMFYECSSLNYIKCLATDISASDCTSVWVDGVASTGTFVKNANMSSWGTGVNGIPNGWTVQDA
jgi:hypothetical protein